MKMEHKYQLLTRSSLLGGHKYHNMGQAVGLTEPLDERIVSYLKKLITSGCRNSKDLQSWAAEFVQDKIFFGEKHPGSLRYKFNANRKKIKNLLYRSGKCTKVKRRLGKMDRYLFHTKVIPYFLIHIFIMKVCLHLTLAPSSSH